MIVSYVMLPAIYAWLAKAVLWNHNGPRSIVGVVTRIPLPEEAALCFNCAAAAYSYGGLCYIFQ
jgi:hypothetical protein